MQKPVLFFDIGDTLGVARIVNGNLQGIDLFPFVPEILERLSRHCRLGILSNTGDESLETMKSVLEAAGIGTFFEGSIQLFSSVEGMDKTNIEFFRRAIHKAGVPASMWVYVSESDAERATARRAGMKVSYHALHVFHEIQGIA